MTVEEIIARAYDTEEASQMGEPSPWSVAADDSEWVSERLHCAKAALMMLEAAGFVVVPKEPTDAMIAAAQEAVTPKAAKGGSFALLPRRIDTAVHGYAAMIEARPK